MNPVENFWPIWDPEGPKNLAHRGHFSHTPESTHNMHVNQVWSSHIKNFLREWPKTSNIPIFLPIFCNLRFIKEREAKHQNSTSTTFWAIVLCTFKPNIRKIRQQGKSEGFDNCDRPSNVTQIGFKSSINQTVWPWNLNDEWAWKTKGHPFYTTLSFVQHFNAIGVK